MSIIAGVLVLHPLCHRARNERPGDLCFVPNVEDAYAVGAATSP
jgi:predicted MarR family transcription regulator